MRYSHLLLVAATTTHAQNVLPRAIYTEQSPPSLHERANFSEPCAEVAASWLQQSKNSTSIVVPADVALNCLHSVPVDVAGDLQLIEEIQSLVQFQSTLSYLKQAEEPHNQAVDILGALTQIANMIKKGSLSNEYDVQMAITNLIGRAHDFHFFWSSDIKGVFSWVRPRAVLVSLAKDVLSLPEVYFEADVKLSLKGGFTPSPITTINGQNVTEYLNTFADLELYHDADTRYNQLFPNFLQRSVSPGLEGSFASPSIYPGVNTTYGFANGTTLNYKNVAVVSGNFSTITDGKSLFKAFCTGGQKTTKTTTTTPSSASGTPTPESLPTPNGYPSPVIVQSSLQVQGYYLNGTNYTDVAVLALPTFSPVIGTGTKEKNAMVESQKVMRAFLSDAVSKGKKKLVIDLRGNGGGSIALGYDLFKQLFPSEIPYGGTRLRAHEAVRIALAAIGDFTANATLQQEKPGLFTEIEEWYSAWDWENILNVDGQAFKSYWDFYGPNVINGDNFTAIRRYNLSNPYSSPSGATFNVTGYRSLSKTEAQPFARENIVLLQDGGCGSTCAIFSELMREQGKVHQIAVGGIPQYAPMQGVGGSKGAQLYMWDNIVTIMSNVLNHTSVIYGYDTARIVNNTIVGQLAAISQTYVRTSHSSSSNPILGGVNSLNNYRRNDTSNTPLEFIYEATDCRLFNSFDSYKDVTLLWKTAVDVKWGGAQCVRGSTGDNSSLSGTGDAFQVKNASRTQEQFTGGASGLEVKSIFMSLIVMVVATLLL